MPGPSSTRRGTGDLGPGRRDEEAVRQFVEHLSMTLADQGFPRMPARVLLTLMSADEEALTAAEIGQRLGVSPAAVSGAVRFLTHVGLLDREPVPGSRRDRYRMPDDAWYLATLTKETWLTTVIDHATAGVGALGGTATTAGRRVADMRDFYAFVQGEMDGMLARWRTTRR